MAQVLNLAMPSAASGTRLVEGPGPPDSADLARTAASPTTSNDEAIASAIAAVYDAQEQASLSAARLMSLVSPERLGIDRLQRSLVPGPDHIGRRQIRDYCAHQLPDGNGDECEFVEVPFCFATPRAAPHCADRLCARLVPSHTACRVHGDDG